MKEKESVVSARRGSRRREFGSIRKTSSGRFQARYTAPDGTMRKAPSTFETKRLAEEYLAEVRSQLYNRKWRDPARTCPTINEYFSAYQDSRIGRGGGAIRASTRALADDQFRRFIQPVLGSYRLDAVRAADVNRWYASLPDRPALRRQLYSLAKALFQQALRDELLYSKNPCQIPRAGQNPPSSRPSFNYVDVSRVISHLPPEVAILADIAFGAHLRLGEALALKWRCIDLKSGVIEVSRSVTEVNNQQLETATKTDRVREVKLGQEFRIRLRAYAILNHRDPDARIVSRPDGAPMRHFHVHTAWNRARILANVPSIRFHDLRHVGLTMLAEGGMPLRSLMYRAGHTTVDAALVYQHRAASWGEVEAETLASRMEVHRSQFAD